MKRFVLIIAAATLLLELGCRLFERALFDASHRALLKIALLDQQPEITTVVLGSSRNGLGFLPALYDARVRALGHREKSFNLAISGLSYEIERYLIERLQDKRLSRVFVELGEPPISHAPLAWADPHPLALLRLRSAFRHDGLVRLLAITTASARFDGSETSGGDYLSALWREHDARCDGCEGIYPLPEPQPAEDGEQMAELEGYREVLAPLQEAGAQIILTVPPLSREDGGRERTPQFRAQAKALAFALHAPLYDFTDIAGGDLKDTQHLSPRGAERYTDLLARIAARESERGPRAWE